MLISALSYNFLNSFFLLLTLYHSCIASAIDVSSLQPSIRLSSSTEVLAQCSIPETNEASASFDTCGACILQNQVPPGQPAQFCGVDCCGEVVTNKETAHARWCFNGCCHRIIVLDQSRAPPPKVGDPPLLSRNVFIVNDVSQENGPSNCRAKAGNNKNCSRRCATADFFDFRCKEDTVAVTKFGEQFKDRPCSSTKTNGIIGNGETGPSDKDEPVNDNATDTDNTTEGSSTGNGDDNKADNGSDSNELSSSTEVLDQCTIPEIREASPSWEACGKCIAGNLVAQSQPPPLCPDNCCGNIGISKDTVHIRWCFNSCCHRLILLDQSIAPPPKQGEPNLSSQHVFVVNDVTLQENGPSNVCSTKAGENEKCSRRCASADLFEFRCKEDTVAVTKFGEQLKDRPCSSTETNGILGNGEAGPSADDKPANDNATDTDNTTGGNPTGNEEDNNAGNGSKSNELASSTEILDQCSIPDVREANRGWETCADCVVRNQLRLVKPLRPCPKNCCGNVAVNKDTTHIRWCLNGCCHRVIVVDQSFAPTPKPGEPDLFSRNVFVVNDVILQEGGPNNVCRTKAGENKKCSPRCASADTFEFRCKEDTVVATKFGEQFKTRPCSSASTNGIIEEPEEVPSDDVESTNDNATDTGDKNAGNSTGSEEGNNTQDDNTLEENSAGNEEDEDSTSNSNNADDQPSCFPAAAVVHRHDGVTLRMDQLSIGDTVLCNGKQEYSQIIGFSHADHTAVSRFREISLNSGDYLTASSGHFVYCRSQGTPGNVLRVVRMDGVKVGDEMMLGNGTTSTVMSIKDVAGKGIFNPHTRCGEIVVNGIVATTYTASLEVGIAHSLLLPVRLGNHVRWAESYIGEMVEYSSRVGRSLIENLYS